MDHTLGREPCFFSSQLSSTSSRCSGIWSGYQPPIHGSQLRVPHHITLRVRAGHVRPEPSTINPGVAYQAVTVSLDLHKTAAKGLQVRQRPAVRRLLCKHTSAPRSISTRCLESAKRVLSIAKDVPIKIAPSLSTNMSNALVKMSCSTHTPRDTQVHAMPPNAPHLAHQTPQAKPHNQTPHTAHRTPTYPIPHTP